MAPFRALDWNCRLVSSLSFSNLERQVWRGKESDSPAGGTVKRIAGKDPEDWPRERLDILALNVFISVHRQSKQKLRVSRALPKVETVKQLRPQPSILSVFRRQWGQQKSSTLDSVR